MAITYREGGVRLSVGEMDDNFHYIEDELVNLGASFSQLETMVESLDLAGLTASVITLGTNLASATASIVTLNTNVASATASIVTLRTNLASATASIAGLENAFSNITGSFNFLLLVGGVTQSGTFSFTSGILGTYSI